LMEPPKHPLSSRYLSKGLFQNLKSFEELESRISSLPTKKERGYAFEVFAEAYFATQKTVQARQVYPFESVPFSILKKLSLDTGRDMGVDGIVEARSGEVQAYQVKFRSGRPSLTWQELSTFMGLSDQVDQRILFTNCYDLPSVMNERSGFFCIRGNDLDRLEKRDFEEIQNWLQGNYHPAPRKIPRPHQEQALEAITEALKINDRATALMACGTGKTLVALWIAERMECRNILVLVPSLALLRQTLHEWLKETHWENLSYLCVCSDPTVTRNVDELVVRQSDADFPVSTDCDLVRKFLSRDGTGTKVVFSTYQSAWVVAEGMDGWGSFDLGIFDEAHKTAGREGTKFAFALTDENLPIAKRLFMTATPRHYDIRKKDEEGDANLVFSMDDQEFYGNVAYDLSFARASDLGIICDYKVIISVVTSGPSGMVTKEHLKRGEVIVGGDIVDAVQVANQIALQQAVEKYGAEKIITFHRTVKEAQTFTGEGPESIVRNLPHYLAYNVSGTQRTSEREKTLKEFRQAKTSIISNARCLTEGVDVPAVDMVAFLSPRKSRIDIVQATGRAMRKSSSKNKTTGYVLVPLFLEMDKGETVEEAVEKGKFEEIWSVLQAMKEQDSTLSEIIRQMRENVGKTGNFDSEKFEEKVEFLGPELTLNQISESITSISIDKLGDTWDERYGELILFRKKFGHSNVPSYYPENIRLGKWAEKQRTFYNQGRLSKDRIERLESVGFIWNPLDTAWEEMFAELALFKEQFGHCNVPTNYPENRKLGRWVDNQRTYYNQSRLSKDRLERLESIGFTWRGKNPLDTAWEEMFAELALFKEQFGHSNVPQQYTENKKLGKWVKWVSHQRTLYKQGRLSKDRIERLESIGFTWRGKNPLDTAWDKRFAELVRFKEQYGHSNVPQQYTENKKLGKWVDNQRHFYKQGRLSKDRIGRLEDIGFKWRLR